MISLLLPSSAFKTVRARSGGLALGEGFALASLKKNFLWVLITPGTGLTSITWTQEGSHGRYEKLSMTI